MPATQHGEVVARFQCDKCQRTFSRGDHRARHLLSHSNVKPFACIKCHETFRRQDVLRRHEARYCPDAAPASERSRARRACDTCRAKKVKCNGELPCRKCEGRARDCTYAGHSIELGAERDARGFLNNEVPPAFTTPMLLSPALVDSVSTADEGASKDVELHSTPGEFQFDWNDDFLQWDSFGHTADFLDLGDYFDLSHDITQQESEHSLTSLSGEHPGTAFERFDRVRSLGGEYPTISDPRIKQLLQQPCLPVTYDRELFGFLIGLFNVHVAPLFSSFANINMTEGTPAELVLAMAAVGATFSNIEEGQLVACALYKHAQRIMSHEMLTGECSSTMQQLVSHIQTVILLELFGICSADPRSGELIEGFHPHLCHSLERLINTWVEQNQDANPSHDVRQLTADVLMVECYRTLILQRTPLMVPSLIPELPMPSSGEGPTSATFLSHQVALLNTNDTRNSYGPTWCSITCLSALSHLCQGSYSTNSYEAQNRPWSTDIICAAFSRLVDKFQSDAGCNQAILCYANVMVLYSPIQELLEELYLLITNQELLSPLSGVLQNWRRSSDRLIALNHAMAAISCAERMVLGSNSAIPDKSYIELPHDAWCVYLAAVIVWHGQTEVDGGTRSVHRSALETSRCILARLKVTIASKMHLAITALASAAL